MLDVSVSRLHLSTNNASTYSIINRRRGRVGKGVGHFDHVWSYGVREVVSSIPDLRNIVGWVFHPTRWLVRFSLIWTCRSFQILNIFRTLSSWGSGNYRPSAPLLYEVASHNFHASHYYYYHVDQWLLKLPWPTTMTNWFMCHDQ